MKNKFSEILDVIADEIKGRDNDLFTPGKAAEETKEKLTELEKD